MALDSSRVRVLGVSRACLSPVAWIVVGMVAVLHYVIVWRCAVNVPYWDEWEIFSGAERLPEKLSWSWLLTQHNEHRILFTRLQTWFLFPLNGWDISSQIRMNFAIFLLMVGLLTWMVHRAVPAAPGWFLALCFLSQITDLSSENHLWGFQSQFHVTLLGLMFSVYLLFVRQIGWCRLGGGLAVLLFSIFSFSAGLSGSAMLVLAFGLYRLSVWKDFRVSSFTREVLMIGVVGVVWGLAVKFYLHEHNRMGPAMVLPNDPLFWDHYSNLLSLGFGYTRLAVTQSVASTLIVFVTVGFFSWRLLRGKTRVVYSEPWVQLLVLSLIVLASLATISMGRAGYGLSNAKSSRYAEIATILVPCVAGLWLGSGSRKKILSDVMVVATVLIAAFGMRNNFRFMSDYPMVKKQREAGLRCVRRTLEGRPGHGTCPNLYPFPIEDRIRYAESRGASFISEARETKARR